jgi:ABC-2 type transport system permease protein
MYPPRIFAIVLRVLYLIRESPARVLPLVIWVAMDIILWGFLSRYLNSMASGFNLIPALLGAVLLWDFFGRVMQGVTTAFFEDVWSRNFLNIFATPLSISEYVCGLILASVATSSVGLVVMLILATFVFGLSFFLYGALVVPFVAVLFLSGIAMGIFGISIVLRYGPAAEWLVWPIPALLSPFVGVFYPLGTLPHWMQLIARMLPPSYVFEGLRSIVHDHSASLIGLSIAFLLAIGYVLLAAWTFTRIFQHAVRTGLIARYSAESVN